MANHQRSTRRSAIVIVAIVALVAAGAYWWRTSREAAIGRGALTLSGTVESTEYQVASALAGRITTITVVEGDSVERDDVIATLNDAALKLQVTQAEQGVEAAKAQVRQAKDDGTDAEEDAARARQKQAEAAVKIAKIQQGYATIKAPNGGTVVSVPANVGQNAGPGKAVATIADPGDLFVRVYVPEPSLGDVRLGQEARVIASGGTFDGTVSFISSSAEFTPNTVETEEQRGNLVYEVRIRVANPSGALKAGLPVDVELARQ
jgi:HlyD family secretion protein